MGDYISAYFSRAMRVVLLGIVLVLTSCAGLGYVAGAKFPPKPARAVTSMVLVVINGDPYMLVYSVNDGSQGAISLEKCLMTEKCKADVERLSKIGMVGQLKLSVGDPAPAQSMPQSRERPMHMPKPTDHFKISD